MDHLVSLRELIAFIRMPQIRELEERFGDREV